MTTTTIANGNTRTTQLVMVGSDVLTIDLGGALSTADNPGVLFNAATNGAVITNNGTLENTGGGRAIRFTTGVGTSFSAAITNNNVIQSSDDAIQIQAGSVTSGILAINNSAGSIVSTTGQALDLAGGTGTFHANVANAGNIMADASDAIRFGGIGTLINSFFVGGGSDVGTFVNNADGVQFEDNATGTVENNGIGQISGDRHGINAGLNTVVAVVNNGSGTITGRNGSGVGLDGSGTVTNFGTITGAFSDSAGRNSIATGRPR
jgi:hypothetical protein